MLGDLNEAAGAAEGTRNYSPSTIRGYVLAVQQFAEYFGKPTDRLGTTHIRFHWYLLQERILTPGTVEMRMSALRFFFTKMLKTASGSLQTVLWKGLRANILLSL